MANGSPSKKPTIVVSPEEYKMFSEVQAMLKQYTEQAIANQWKFSGRRLVDALAKFNTDSVSITRYSGRMSVAEMRRKVKSIDAVPTPQQGKSASA